MFFGTYEHAIDDKGRITIPAKYRRWLDLGVVITKGIERCLLAYPTEGWQEFVEKARALPLTNTGAREFKRLLFGGASECEPDKQGRIVLQQRLREYANIDNQVIFIGLDDHFEIWNAEIWREAEAKGDNDPDWRAENFANLGF